MDFAYDEIATRTFSNDRSTTPRPGETSDSETTSTTPTKTSEQPQRQNLQTEFQETFKAFSNSPWGTKLGGWWSTARTQGASYYETARKEAEKREAEAAKALEEARKVVVERTKIVVEAAENQLDNIVNEDKKAELEAARKEKEAQERQAQQDSEEGNSRDAAETSQEDTETFLNRFKSEAAKRLKEVQKAEDAADEALLRFGTNVRNFLKDTISVTASELSSQTGSSEVLFESRDGNTGKRVIHTSRFDAQLHVIHSTPSSFTEDPDAENEEWTKFKSEFDIEKKTDTIASDLEKYPELRAAMEKLVPEKVEYKDFWSRYYFLRHVIELREEKRKELLKGMLFVNHRSNYNKYANFLPASAAAEQEEEAGWDSESDSEEPAKTNIEKATATSSAQTPHTRTDSDAATLRAPRRSHDEKSVADSEASYDLVSGAASHAHGSPKEKPVKEEDSDDDWE